MSTTELGRFDARPAARAARPAGDASALAALRWVLTPLASLRLTVVLLFLSLVLVLAGTLAQVDHEIWYVVRSYFRVWLSWFELRIFFPRAWGISESIIFPFPGGKTLGVLLAANLLAAHAVRFKVAAHGKRLWLGWATIAIGAAITYAVIISGSNIAAESEISAAFANGLWHALRAAIGGAALAMAYSLALTRAQARKSTAWWVWMFGAAIAALLAGLAVYLFTHPEARLNAAGLRILWQLTKAAAATLILAAGCWAVFKKRAGIVLIHGGVALVMFAELYTAQYAVEAQMRIEEGQTAYYADDIRGVELAFTDVSSDKVDSTIAIPAAMLQEAARTGTPISFPKLPYDVRVVKYVTNARTRRVQPGETATATAGMGQLYTADELPPVSGVKTEAGADLPVAYIELLSKPDGKSQGLYLGSLVFRNQALTVGDKPYEMALRFKRIPKPYEVTLVKFKHEVYVGSDKAKNFESVVRFQDPAHNIDRTTPIYMNNPLRYGADTLYQADWNKETEAGTVLQVVTNGGWMVPYVACVIVGIGMLVHFTQNIVRFVLRREEDVRQQLAMEADISGLRPEPSKERWTARWSRAEYWVPALVVLMAAAMTYRYAAPPREKPLDMHIAEFGRLPVVYGGRTQPMESLAQNTLRVLSGKATFVDAKEKKQPAMRWLLDVISQSPDYLDHHVIRIVDLDVLQTLGLKQKPGDWRYSIAEILHDRKEVDRQVKLAQETPEAEQNKMQTSFLALNRKLSTVIMLIDAFSPAEIRGETKEDIQLSIRQLLARIDALNAGAPHPVPPQTADGAWKTLMEADKDNTFGALDPRSKHTPNPAVKSLTAILTAYSEGSAAGFNSALNDYRELVAKVAVAENEHETSVAVTGERSGRKPAERLDLDRIRFEAFFDHFDPFIVCLVFYIAAFLLASLAWVGWPAGFNRSANWLLWFTFGLHTFGLVCRIYISGRPPVTNLYSSAVFIGWAAVLMFLLFEVVYKLGIGNLVAAAIGVPTMFIAYQLTFDDTGDTLGVMQAVLDTNFWLGTHVVCVALGYTASFATGGLGLITLLMGYLGGVLPTDLRKQITRMTYGALCFAIFFSFVGTVLGGLWADDSWGRFWGWDPKENGALMIVLWNAIVLHARWGKMVGERGLAALVVLGNIVVAWSWWGVNQLGVGLHSYGEISGITFWLVTFAVSQVAIVAAVYALPLFTHGENAPPAMAGQA